VRLLSSEFGVGFGDYDRVNLQAVLERIWRYTWRLRSSKVEDALGGRYRARLDDYVEAVDGWRARCSDSIHHLVSSQL